MGKVSMQHSVFRASLCALLLGVTALGRAGDLQVTAAVPSDSSPAAPEALAVPSTKDAMPSKASKELRLAQATATELLDAGVHG